MFMAKEKKNKKGKEVLTLGEENLEGKEEKEDVLRRKEESKIVK
jgi:hypothetical protein